MDSREGMFMFKDLSSLASSDWDSLVDDAMAGVLELLDGCDDCAKHGGMEGAIGMLGEDMILTVSFGG